MAGKGAQAAQLPEISHKFSSWAKEDQNLNELDELLMEHDLLQESLAAGSKGHLRAQIQVTRANGNSPDCFDLEEVMDEFGENLDSGGGNIEDASLHKNQNGSKQQTITDESNSFDLDNSDDLNRFIQKYETMLDGEGYTGKKLTTTAKPQLKTLARDRSRDLEDSWGSLQQQAEQMLAGGGEIEDETTSADVTKRNQQSAASMNESVSTNSAAA